MEEAKENNPIKKKFWTGTRIIIAVVVSIVIFALTILAVNKPEYIGWAVGIGAALGIIGGFGMFIPKIIHFFKGKFPEENKKSSGDVPEPASTEQILAKLNEFVVSQNFQNHLKNYTSYRYNFGKNEIYEFRVTLLYDEIEFKGNECYIYFNANYLDKIPSILPTNAGTSRRKATANFMSSSPEDFEEDIHRTESIDPLTGRQVISEKKTKRKKPKQSEKEEEKFE